jgi:hypothetical protein
MTRNIVLSAVPILPPRPAKYPLWRRIVRLWPRGRPVQYENYRQLAAGLDGRVPNCRTKRGANSPPKDSVPRRTLLLFARNDVSK